MPAGTIRYNCRLLQPPGFSVEKILGTTILSVRRAGKVVIGGDTFPNKWYIEHATGADVAIHETFLTPPDLVKFYGQSPGQAIGVGTQIHTSPPAFGKVMSTIKPRLAIGYHFFNEQGTHDNILQGVRSTYSGPLSLAVDNMVWNITKDKLTTRMAVANPESYPPPAQVPAMPPVVEENAYTWDPFSFSGLEPRTSAVS